MERVRGSFDKYGLFQSEGGTVETVNPYEAVSTKIDKWWDSFLQIAYRLNEGDFTKAEKFLDCGVFEFYYRVKQKHDYIEWHNSQMKVNKTE